MSVAAIDLATAAAALEASDAFRVLRRFVARDRYNAHVDDPGAAPLRTGLYLDVETTGTDTVVDEIIELAIVPFEFDAAGRIYDVGGPACWMNDPGRPIPPEVTALTGITTEAVQGQSIDDAVVQWMLSEASLVVAHHADFDRRFMERRFPDFAKISWGCSYREVPWVERFGTSSAKLVHILADTCREFYAAHRAADDCLVGIHVLASATLDERCAFSYLLDAVRRPTSRISAVGAPFETKDRLKARGYRWNASQKLWHIDVAPEALADEVQWLRFSVGVSSPRIEKLTARDRYSIRSDR